ncbi:dTDP-4-dehydrorhamnose 3,5-epimerase [Yersinia enterocolitica]|uniref:dTDP-4-dehydrorhamnose 3,5-epimerase n=1 Tax=Yersinia enterocolitica TaxID=630 RepID=UPI001C6099F5|nr:dTDP-4-dehydrorhamnose 3,5-epimerase [Yersinia enterocolitica]MBW5837610.1 dTDP-4-dehydrorhamnose 3,5-epimerase [Yersinia enterocolitica]
MFISTEIEGIYIFEPKIFHDNRGYFYESYNKKYFDEIGIEFNIVQQNQSYSKYGTIRGLHYQSGNMAQAKFVSVLKGEVLDVAVDLRVGSPTFGLYKAVKLTSEKKNSLFISKRFAHGFSVLSEDAVLSYICDNSYSPTDEGGILFNDAKLNIDWGIPEDLALVSDKDRSQPLFDEYVNNPWFVFNE